MTEHAWTAGRFRLRARGAQPFSKMDLLRTQRRVALASLPASYQALVTSVGHGRVGGASAWVEILSPDEVVEETERLRKKGFPPRSAWDASLLPGAVVIARFSFGDLLAWVSTRERFVRVPSDPAHAVSDLGPDLAGALDLALHLMGAPTELDVTSA